MSRFYLYFPILFSFCLFYGTKGYGQAIYKSVPGDDCSAGNRFFDACWEILGDCVVEDPVAIRPIPPAVEHEFTEGDDVIIGEMLIQDVDEDGNPIIDEESGEIVMVMVADYIVTLEGVRLEAEVGEIITVGAGYTIYYADGNHVEVMPLEPDPIPIYEIGGTGDCSITFQVKDEITVENLHLKDNITIEVLSDGVLNIGNLTQEGGTTANILVDGGEINLNRLVTEAGIEDSKTELNITINNQGQFKVNGLIDLKNHTDLNLKGDGSSFVETEEIASNNWININIKDGGGLKVNSQTRINGNSTVFNIEGHFETNSLWISGGGDLGFNAKGNSTVTVHGDVDVRGSSGNPKKNGATSITFGGDSEVNIGGNLEIRGNAIVNFDDESTTIIEGSVDVNGGAKLNVSGKAELDIYGGCEPDEINCQGGLLVDGNSNVNITDTSQVYVCGIQPEANATSGTDSGKVKVSLYCEDPTADGLPCATYSGCRILPVNFIDIAIEHEKNQRFNTLSWSTSKEWENSHFEIERSIDETLTFEMIGQITGRGWTDEVTEYSFEDEELPLTGGNVFYRLKQVDFNGNYDYSDISAVRVPNVHFTKGVWRAYPNPMVGSDFNLELVNISQYHDEPVTLRMLSSNISSDEMTFHNLQELSHAAASFMTNVPTGLWIFEIQWGNNIERIKVMKQ